ncbi:MAG: hypothetical protein ACKN9F_04070 [Methylomonas sp.]
MGALSKIRSSGFSVSLVGDGLAISPAQNLTDNQRDFLKQHKAEIISELQAEQLATAANINLNPEHRKLLIDYMAAIGEADQGLIDELLSQCSQSPEKLRWTLSWARSIIKPVIRRDVMVKCCNCYHWQPIHPHGKGAGHCGAGVQSLGVCHWFDTPKQCEQFAAKVAS